MKSHGNILLIDVGNTHAHVGLADDVKVRRTHAFPRASWSASSIGAEVQRWAGARRILGAVVASVVPSATPAVVRALQRCFRVEVIELKWDRLKDFEFDYPRPETIGADRLANAIALKHRYGWPALAIDFGTAATIEVLDARGRFCGGIIAPGWSAMSDYLHERTALLPQVRGFRVRRAIGKSTEESIAVAIHRGYPAMIDALAAKVLAALRRPLAPVVATGGYARAMAPRVPAITCVDPTLTLEGLRLFWLQLKADRDASGPAGAPDSRG
jgi:type III pantothenate kinase